MISLTEPNAMTLATVSPEGRPSARIVLLKGFSEEGFLFYTNYHSRKGKELAEKPFAALVFCWLPHERQIRIEGRVEQISKAQSLTYFQSRPRQSQLGAWASPQSETIADRMVLENRFAELDAQFTPDQTIPLPPHWGGYRVIPDKLEFWQGRASRLHDRICYTLQSDQSWKIDRLAP